MDNHLIIFIKNPVFSNVKKELDPKSGSKSNLIDFFKLMEHTANISNDISASKHLYYDEFIENDSFFNDQIYAKKIHSSKDPKIQLFEALKEVFGHWAKKVIFIGTDSLELEQKDIEHAFDQLDYNDVVIMPEEKGGILMFGMTFFKGEILNHFPWGYEDDLLDTIIELQKAKKTYCVLEAKKAN